MNEGISGQDKNLREFEISPLRGYAALVEIT